MSRCHVCWWSYLFVFFFKQKTAYEMRISDWSSDVCSSDLLRMHEAPRSFQARITTRVRQVHDSCRHWKLGSPSHVRHVRPVMAHRRMGQVSGPVCSADSTGDTVGGFRLLTTAKIGRASCRERVCQYV